MTFDEARLFLALSTAERGMTSLPDDVEAELTSHGLFGDDGLSAAGRVELARLMAVGRGAGEIRHERAGVWDSLDKVLST